MNISLYFLQSNVCKVCVSHGKRILLYGIRDKWVNADRCAIVRQAC